MKYAWIENDRVRDVCNGDPIECYHPDVAKFYDTQVPDDAVNGDGWVNGQLIKPAPPPPPPPSPRIWTAADIRAGLTLAERVIWDSDEAPVVKTAKIEMAVPQPVETTTEVLQLLVNAGTISQASMDKILA